MTLKELKRVFCARKRLFWARLMLFDKFGTADRHTMEKTEGFGEIVGLCTGNDGFLDLRGLLGFSLLGLSLSPRDDSYALRSGLEAETLGGATQSC